MFLEEHPWPLLIDEAQYAPELFSYIKINVDNEKQRGMYWLTGSQQFKLMKNVTESLAGRVGIVRLNSFTYAEAKQNLTKVPFSPLKFKSADKIDVKDIFEFRRFMVAVASRNGEQLNYSSIANEIGISDKTANYG